jgi:hypothetical protein
MSDRNTALLLPGHHDPDTIAEAFWSAPGLRAGLFVGPELPRVGHGVRDGQPYTLFSLRLFEVAGLRLMDEQPIPGPADLEVHLGQALSTLAGQAVYVFYDEENAAGGAAVFAKGRLQSRLCFDARPTQPVQRDLSAEVPLVGLDPSDWIWAPASDAIEAATQPILGAGVRDDDDIEALITAAAAEPLGPATTVTPEAAPSGPALEPAPEPARDRRRDRLRGMVRQWLKR